MGQHLRNAKLKGQEKYDPNALVIMLDSDERYTTLLKLNGGYLNLYSTGLNLSHLSFEGDELVFKVKLGDILTVNEFDILNQFVDRVSKK